MTNPHQYCQEKAAASGSSLYYSLLFLPAPRRQAMTALHAFCREVGDIPDECSDPNIARTKLTWWHMEIANLYADNPQHPVTQALLTAIKTYGLNEEHFHEIIDGIEMNLEQNRYQDFKELQLYCYRVASVVNQLSASICGYRDRKTLKYAHDLGIAFQLTNIIRDIGRDARRNRIYLPLDELTTFNVTEADLLHGHETPNARAFINFQIGRAREFYQRAFAELPVADRKLQRPGIIMAVIYKTILNDIECEGSEKVLNQRIRLTPLRKLWLAWKTWIFG